MKWGRLGLAVITVVQFQSLQVHADQNGAGPRRIVQDIDPGLLPIQVKVNTTSDASVDGLFNPQPRMPVVTPGGAATGTTTTTTPNPGVTSAPGGVVVAPIVPKPGVSIMKDSGLKGDFRCNLFENSESASILDAINTLNQAVGSPSCGGGAISVQSVQDNNKIISDTVTSLQGFLQNPETVQADSAAGIANSVDRAIRAANALATAFASSDLANKTCRERMSGGQVVLALNDIVNGLTPYALMAATMTGGTAAIPFIVGGSVITSTLKSMNDILKENSTKINDSQVRHAIVENTCQFIRLDQKYKFLVKNRDEQIKKISLEIANSQRLFGTRIEGLSKPLNNLVLRKNALSVTFSQIDDQLGNAIAQIKMDKSFILGTTDETKICLAGIQLATLAQDQTSYVSTMLGSIDKAMYAYGSTSIVEAQTLKLSAKIASNNLMQFSNTQLATLNPDFSGCAKTAKSFVETIEQSADLSKRIVKLAEDNVDRELKNNQEYSRIQSRNFVLTQKKLQAQRIVGSLDNLQQYATIFTQAEIDTEMARLRAGLFGQRIMGINSPVMAWFSYTQGLHNAAVKDFNTGLSKLQFRIYEKTKSSNNPMNNSLLGLLINKKQMDRDWESSKQLSLYKTSVFRPGTLEYTNSCRELQEVWTRWMTAIDQLSAVESFCSMIEPYVYDSRPEDIFLVQMCRGGLKGYDAFGAASVSISDLQQLKQKLIKDGTSRSALLLKSKIDGLQCPQ